MRGHCVPRRSTRRSDRRGASAIESAFALPVFLLIVLGALDLGLAVFRQHQVTATAHFIARKAIVHGSRASKLGVWGPATRIGNAADGSEIGNLIASFMPGPQASQISYEVAWPDGGNEPRDNHRLRVRIAVNHQPIVTSIFGVAPMTLRSGVTTPIAH